MAEEQKEPVPIDDKSAGQKTIKIYNRNLPDSIFMEVDEASIKRILEIISPGWKINLEGDSSLSLDEKIARTTDGMGYFAGWILKGSAEEDGFLCEYCWELTAVPVVNAGHPPNIDDSTVWRCGCFLRKTKEEGERENPREIALEKPFTRSWFNSEEEYELIFQLEPEKSADGLWIFNTCKEIYNQMILKAFPDIEQKTEKTEE